LATRYQLIAPNFGVWVKPTLKRAFSGSVAAPHGHGHPLSQDHGANVILMLAVAVMRTMVMVARVMMMPMVGCRECGTRETKERNHHQGCRD